MTNISKVNALFSRTAVEIAIAFCLPTLMLIACFTPFEEEKEIAVRVLFFIISVIFIVPSLVAAMLTLIVGLSQLDFLWYLVILRRDVKCLGA